jgi:hypothetical protein
MHRWQVKDVVRNFVKDGEALPHQRVFFVYPDVSLSAEHAGTAGLPLGKLYELHLEARSLG